MGFGMFGIIDSLFPVFFIIIFVIVIGMFIATAIRGASEWNKNNQSPVLTVDATLVGKRESHSHHHHNNGNGADNIAIISNYYITFEVQSGDRMEFNVSGREYGQLVEGDKGSLTFQGTRYHSFERRR